MISSISRQISVIPRASNSILSRISAYSTQQPQSSEPDALYKYLTLELKSHEPAVLQSYETFVQQAATELEVPHIKTWAPRKYTVQRKEVLKSPFGHKKHYVHYEMRTYHRIMEFKNVTGSTADTFLEYIQRNLPEGTAMKVIKHALANLPSHLTDLGKLKSGSAQSIKT